MTKKRKKQKKRSKDPIFGVDAISEVFNNCELALQFRGKRPGETRGAKLISKREYLQYVYDDSPPDP